jgi:hypothetical protein
MHSLEVGNMPVAYVLKVEEGEIAFIYSITNY